MRFVCGTSFRDARYIFGYEKNGGLDFSTPPLLLTPSWTNIFSQVTNIALLSVALVLVHTDARSTGSVHFT